MKSLLAYAPDIVDQLISNKAEECFEDGKNSLVMAVEDIDAHMFVQKEIWQDSNYPYYALMALDSEEITLAQFTSIILYWSASQECQCWVTRVRKECWIAT